MMKFIPEETAEALLMERWLGLRDNANDEAIKLADEYLFAFWQLGLVDDIGVDGWKARFRRCPGHSGEGGRAWCAYCGNMPDPCRAMSDGDCVWEGCPQTRDGEPSESGRHCPLDTEREKGFA